MIVDITGDENFNQVISGSRAREIFDIDTMLTYGHVILYGEAGIGKTALLKSFQTLNTRGYQTIGFWSGYEIELNESLLAPYLMPREIRRHNEPSSLLIIDGFDEIQSPSIKEKLSSIMREGRNYGQRVILSARRQINEKVFEQNARTLRLHGLKDQDVRRLVDIYDSGSNEHPDVILTVRDMMSEFRGNPREIISALNLLLPQTQDAEAKFVYQNSVIIEELAKPTLVLQDAPKIITDIRVVNKRILDKINRQPKAIYQLTPRQFEILVAELFEERGYKVELTQQTRDGGKDLIILDHREVGNLMIYAECKQNAPNRPVGVNVVSDLVGRMTADRATAGIVVTSSYFSPDAKTFQSKFEHQMTLIDFVKLSTMITDIPNKHRY